ncbi:Uma2 family endonuclease [Bacillus pinisoli]|uniref:Uma2 family endonuclease n=1 Tax=Bacillus pinisoli TaxID=2901866 RepID=UPI001FF58FF4|nr:Uma2 family endonuclease [Bacillus pinisoli]
MDDKSGGYVSLEEYLKIRESNEELLEYIDGTIFMTPSPSTKHQRISNKIQFEFSKFLQGKSCEVFAAPYDIELKNEKMAGTKIVIPDISIICDKSGFTEANYIGVPNLIVEILSPSNQSHDLITKLNLYMNYGVREYWIINPMLHSITVYTLNNEGMYEQFDMKTERGNITSKFLEGLKVDVEAMFM